MLPEEARDGVIGQGPRACQASVTARNAYRDQPGATVSEPLDSVLSAVGSFDDVGATLQKDQVAPSVAAQGLEKWETALGVGVALGVCAAAPVGGRRESASALFKPRPVDAPEGGG
ncbi:hypothetical protein PSP31121_05573 [Pandoraea sputorum]|uniref:Uncharacterized protein n=1 Tax=Pandoraea sputorum TaxID=93222 RepID=A0A5E5BNQ7_9BURK|nr:hypothetical protein PSP31121_05573 [Pandoraea sputorum]